MFLFIFSNGAYELIKACDIDEALMLLYDIRGCHPGIDKDLFFDIIRYHNVSTAVQIFNALRPENMPELIHIYGDLNCVYTHTEEKPNE